MADQQEVFEAFTLDWNMKDRTQSRRIVLQQRRDISVLQKEIRAWECFAEENGGKDHIVAAVAHLEACEFARNTYPE